MVGECEEGCGLFFDLILRWPLVTMSEVSKAGSRMTSKLSTRYRAVLWWSSFTRFQILTVILAAALRMLRRFLDGACVALDSRLSWCWHSL